MGGVQRRVRDLAPAPRRCVRLGQPGEAFASKLLNALLGQTTEALPNKLLNALLGQTTEALPIKLLNALLGQTTEALANRLLNALLGQTAEASDRAPQANDEGPTQLASDRSEGRRWPSMGGGSVGLRGASVGQRQHMRETHPAWFGGSLLTYLQASHPGGPTSPAGLELVFVDPKI